MQLVLRVMLTAMFALAGGTLLEAAPRATGGDMNTASWGNVVWLVLVAVAAVAFITLAMVGLRSNLKCQVHAVLAGRIVDQASPADARR